MNIIEYLIPNIILSVFPMLIYFIYNCYRELKCAKYNSILFNTALFTSIYLCIKYSNQSNNIATLLACNIPILIAYVKKEPLVAIILSVITIAYSEYILGTYIILSIIKYISYLIIYFIGRKKNLKDKNFIIIMSILQGFFISLEYFFTYHDTIYNFIYIFIAVALFYILPVILLYLFNLADNISSLYQTVADLEKDKQLKNSLFKITHEVKNPIAVCKGYLDMLDIKDEDKISRYIPIIKQEIERSINIMTDFMEFSKIKIEHEILDINVLLEDIIEEMNLLIDSKNIKLSSSITQDEIFINGDYNRLKQVFINLLKNSIESIENNGKINITTHSLNEKYYIEIEDNGCGMNDYTLSKIKELFFTTKTKGSGIGVSLSNEIIKCHEGTIDYKSKEGKGTKVIVKLPITMI